MSGREVVTVAVGVSLLLVSLCGSLVQGKVTMDPSLYEDLVVTHNNEHPLHKYMETYEKYYRDNVLGRRDDDDRGPLTVSGSGDRSPGRGSGGGDAGTDDDGRPDKDKIGEENRQQVDSMKKNVQVPMTEAEKAALEIQNMDKKAGTGTVAKFVDGEAQFRDKDRPLLRYKICRDGDWDYARIVLDEDRQVVDHTQLYESKMYEYFIGVGKDASNPKDAVTTTNVQGTDKGQAEPTFTDDVLAFRELIQNQVCFGDAFRLPATPSKTDTTKNTCGTVDSYKWAMKALVKELEPAGKFQWQKDGAKSYQFCAPENPTKESGGFLSLLYKRMSTFSQNTPNPTKAQQAFLDVFNKPVDENNKHPDLDKESSPLGKGCIDALLHVQDLVQPKGTPLDADDKKSPGGWDNILTGDKDKDEKNKQYMTRLNQCAYFFYRMEVYGYLTDVTCGCEVMADVCDEQLWGMAENTLSDVCFPPFVPETGDNSDNIFCPKEIYPYLYAKAALKAGQKLYEDNPFKESEDGKTGFSGSDEAINEVITRGGKYDRLFNADSDIANEITKAGEKLEQDGIDKCAMVDIGVKTYTVSTDTARPYTAMVGWWVTAVPEGSSEEKGIRVHRTVSVTGGQVEQTSPFAQTKEQKGKPPQLTCPQEFAKKDDFPDNPRDSTQDTCFGDKVDFYTTSQRTKNAPQQCYIERVVKIPGLCLCQKAVMKDKWTQGTPNYKPLVELFKAQFDRSDSSHSCCNCGEEIKAAVDSLEENKKE
eukprot:Nk52_evm4s620 gene=Nk52_evmTU4s620